MKNFFCEKRTTNKLVLDCDDEILNITETLLDKINSLIHTIVLPIVCLLLVVVVRIGCYFYYTKYQPK